MSQGEDRVQDAMGELGKIALIDGGDWVRQLERTRLSGADLLWAFLRPAIQAKLRVVGKDPLEKSGIRQVLNLGHTMGHVLEAARGHTHGQAVAQGLFFAIVFSLRRKLLSLKEAERAFRLLSTKLGLEPERPSKPLRPTRVRDLLLQDKKKSGREEVVFIFMKRFGRVERVSVPIKEIVREGQRQGWVGS